MTKAEIVSEISRTTGLEKGAVLDIVEKFMEVVKDTMSGGRKHISPWIWQFCCQNQKREDSPQYLQEHGNQDTGAQDPVVQALKGIS